jgi:hypothetical protein
MKETMLFKVTSNSNAMTENSGILEKDTVDWSSDAAEDGYNADVEEPLYNTDEEDTWTDDDNDKEVYPSTFPACRKRRRPQQSQNNDTSLLVLSKFLVQYWNAIRIQPPKKKKKKLHCTPPPPLSTRTILPQISCRHVSLEHALSFSPLARILLQAEQPHAVVHANAAYARLRGDINMNNTKEMNVHNNNNNNNNVSLVNAIQNYFACIAAMDDYMLTLYPVCSSETMMDSMPMVTHYLVEATMNAPLNTIPALNKEIGMTITLQAEQHARAVG